MSKVSNGPGAVGDIPGLNSTSTFTMNPTYNKRTSSIPILSAAQTVTDSFMDVGSEISCGTYRYLYLYMTTTIQQANNLRFKFMAKHESGGAEECAMDEGFVSISGTTVTAPSTAAIDYWEQTEDVNADWLIKIELNNCIPYVQVMVSEGTDEGADATVDTLDAVLGY
jgi:hypothetical protein